MAEAANLAVVEQEDAPTTPPKVRRNQSRYNALVDASDPKKRRQQLQKIYEKQKRESQVKKVTKSKYDSHPDVQKAKTPQERRKALNKLYAAQKAMEDSAEQRPIETGVKMEPSEEEPSDMDGEAAPVACEVRELRAKNMAMEDELGSLRNEKQALQKLVSHLENKIKIAERLYLGDVDEEDLPKHLIGLLPSLL
ncbi:unnamed protein product, partial [Symbiodinium microadriaticum]